MAVPVIMMRDGRVLFPGSQRNGRCLDRRARQDAASAFLKDFFDADLGQSDEPDQAFFLYALQEFEGLFEGDRWVNTM